MLSKTNYSFILANEEDDVHPRLVSRARSCMSCARG
jgi:hypothetical protein